MSTIQATLEIKPTEKQLQQLTKELHQEIKESLKLEYIAVDLEILLTILPYSKMFVEENFLQHPKVKRHERRRGVRGKRIWLYEPTKQAILEIMDSWVY